MTFDGERAIVIDRFDRLQVAGVLRRVHQEDCCQALGVLPDNKYESDGGPGISMIVGLLRQSSQQPVDDVNRFLDAVLLNWVLAGTDAHAKNYALLLGSDGGVRLAPFYDIASLLPYEDRRLHRVRLAMQIGGEYLIRHIGRKHWRELAGQNGLHHDALLGRAGDLLTRLPDALNKVAGLAIAAGLAPKVIRGLAARIRERVSQCRKELG